MRESTVVTVLHLPSCPPQKALLVHKGRAAARNPNRGLKCPCRLSTNLNQATLGHSPKNSSSFRAKTQQTGSNSSHMKFKTHFIFSTFAVNEQKVLLFARSAPKNIWPYLVHFYLIFHQLTAIFSKN